MKMRQARILVSTCEAGHFARVEALVHHHFDTRPVAEAHVQRQPMP